MSEVMFFVPGAPVQKERPRVSKTGVFYTPKKTHTYETIVRGAFRAKCPNALPIEGPVVLTVTFTFQIPKSALRKKIPNKIAEGQWNTVRPDLDNLTKSILDALNGYAFLDDSQVAMIVSKKAYSALPGAFVTIRALENQGELPFAEEGSLEN